MSIFFQLRVAQWVGLPNSSYNPITYTAWVPAQLCKLQKRVHLTSLPSDKVYQLLAQGQWFSPGTPASSITKTGRQDIAEILLKVALNSINQLLLTYIFCCRSNLLWSYMWNGMYWPSYFPCTYYSNRTKINIKEWKGA